MIKLSQRAWNNVIIISTLMLILLFNFSSSFLNDSTDKADARLTLIPTEMIITTIEFSHQIIERIGQGWRASSGLHTNDNLAELVSQWHRAEVRLFADDIGVTLPVSTKDNTVKIWFAGQTLPTTYQFVMLADKTLVVIDQTAYELIHPSYQTLILPE